VQRRTYESIEAFVALFCYAMRAFFVVNDEKHSPVKQVKEYEVSFQVKKG
jgi:hypothetical protein